MSVAHTLGTLTRLKTTRPERRHFGLVSYIYFRVVRSKQARLHSKSIQLLGSFRGGTRGNGVPIVKVFKNAQNSSQVEKKK